MKMRKFEKFREELREGILNYAEFINRIDKEIVSKEEEALKYYDKYMETNAERYKQAAIDTYSSVKFSEGFYIIANRSMLLLSELMKALDLGLMTEEDINIIRSSIGKLVSRNAIEWYRNRDEFYDVYDKIRERIPWPVPEAPRLDKMVLSREELEKELEEKWRQWKGYGKKQIIWPEPPKEKDKEKEKEKNQ